MMTCVAVAGVWFVGQLGTAALASLALVFPFQTLIQMMAGGAIVRLRAGTIRWYPVADIMQIGGIGLINSLTIAGTVVTVTAFVAGYGTNALAGYGLGSRP
ncbi:MAG: Na+-driven multidrug efflux pump, partial [Gammaproteobacteria bacterium]